MNIIYGPDISYRRALSIDRIWSESEATGKLFEEILKVASISRGVKNVLDVAAGTGCLLQVLSQTLPEGQAIGIDRSVSMVKLARNKLARAKIDNASVLYSETDDIMFRNAFFDMVFCVLGLYHLSDPRAALLEMKRVLKKGGKLVLCEYEAPADPKLREALTESFQLSHPNYRFFTGTEIHKLVSDAGFSRERSATVRFAFEQYGVGGIPMGVHFFEARFMIERRGDHDLLASFDGNIFKLTGRSRRAEGTLSFAIIRASK